LPPVDPRATVTAAGAHLDRRQLCVSLGDRPKPASRDRLKTGQSQ
jgi:hypothetical protein